MKHEKIVPLRILGKELQFPFTGIFATRQPIDKGQVSIVGRIHDADIKRDFQQTIQFSKVLESIVLQHQDSLKGLCREVWDWFLSVKPHNQIVSLTIQIETRDTLYLSTMGTSGLWGLANGRWYPLLGEGSAVLQDELLEGYPMLMQVESKPEAVVVVPKPIKNQLPTVLGMQKYVYTVGGNQDVD